MVLALMLAAVVSAACPSPPAAPCEPAARTARDQLHVSPSGDLIVGMVRRPAYEAGDAQQRYGWRSSYVVWDVPCLLSGADAGTCGTERTTLTPSHFESWVAGERSFVMQMTNGRVRVSAPSDGGLIEERLGALLPFAWPPGVIRPGFAYPVAESPSATDLQEDMMTFLSARGRTAFVSRWRDGRYQVATDDGGPILVPPDSDFQVDLLGTLLFRHLAMADGRGFYFWSGSEGERGRLFKYRDGQGRDLAVPAMPGPIRVVFTPSGERAAAAFTPDGLRAIEAPARLVGAVDREVRATRAARPGLELKSVAVSDDLAVWALVFSGADGASQLHVLRPATGQRRAVVLSTPAAGPIASRFVGVRGPAGPLPARLYAAGSTPSKRGLIVAFHGGPARNVLDDDGGVTRRYAALGFDVLAVDYRGSPGYGAGHMLALRAPAARVMLEDLRASVAWARRRYGRVGFHGVSAGGLAGVAALADGGAGLDFAVLESPLIDRSPSWTSSCTDKPQGLFRRLFGVESEDGDCRLKSTGMVEHGASVTIPALLVQGDTDRRTPATTARAWLGHVQEAGGCVRQVTSTVGGHTLVNWPAEERASAGAAIAAWLSAVEAGSACATPKP